MKILVLTQYFWPENFRINDLTAGLVEKGYEVTVLTGIPNYPDGKFFPGYGIFKNLRQSYRGAEIIRVPLVSRGRSNKIRLLINYLSFAFYASILAPIICRQRYDVIFVYEPSPITVGLPAIILKKIKSAPIFFWVQDLWPESLSATGAVHSSFIIKYVKKLVQFIYHRCDLILVQSKAFIPSIKSLGVNAARISYFPNSAEEFYSPVKLEANSEERKVMPKGFIIMFAGNIGTAQDFSTIISAAERIRDYKEIHWIIIGDGRKRLWVEEEIAKRNLSANFSLLGRHPAEKMPRYFALADVMLATLKNEEIFSFTIPAKVQSYLACAKPIIASLAGEGARIIEESGAGFSCEPENPEALAQLALKMYHMKADERRAMGLKGREYFENNFERSKLIDQLDRLIKTVKGAR
ncbi:MAG: glycosyltransferase family 4 protein [Candidatus Omnitrophica bacterium]|nr:glycosyltransferase family 4 protein [Candidatus Omnitrophota bacterium]MBU1047362.1 glycosyltransferase family 4 protein [Candidatus Omnitrophota bacterium]MBU1889053.1 glycosyltransferase family 4 protein [Candidatus Omnitrophota bacterium]